MAAAVALAVPAVAHAQGGGQAPPPTAAPPPPPAPRLVVDQPARKVFIREGHAGRLLLGGRWYFRQDDFSQGERQRFHRQRSLLGWTPVGVPHNWNATDTTLNRSSVGWYRKEFRLPKAPRGRRYRWKVRFESANHRAVVWLNGRKIGGNVGGGYFPFEADLDGLKRGRNTLVVKVSTLRSSTDLTHWRAAKFNGFGTGGWWNFGGLLREVYVRPVDTVDIEHVRALPRLRCVRCAARVEVRAELRNLSRRERDVSVALSLGGRRGERQRVTLRRTLAPRQRREVAGQLVIRKPRLWRPGRPSLYPLSVTAAVDGRRRSAYRLAFGVKRIEAARDGGLRLNGRPVYLRGASVVEDDPRTGGVSTVGQRRTILRRLRQLGANASRSHYPLHPALMEAFDRAGILFWSQAPVYQLPNRFLDRASIRRAAIDANRRTVRARANNASVFVWSIANELAESPGEGGRVGRGFATFVRSATRLLRRLDRTRLIGIDRHSRVGEPLFHRPFRSLDVLGVNEYFGWYNAAAPGHPATRTEDLPGFLDRLHRTYPRTPLVVTEFGAEATRPGPESQKGTYEFQQKWVRDHIAIHRSKRYVNGSIHWALKDFRVHPEWSGGNHPAYATPPWHNKSLIEESGALKPAFFDVRRLFRRRGPR